MLEADLKQIAYLISTKKLIVGTDTAAEIGFNRYCVYDIKIHHLKDFLDDAYGQGWELAYIAIADPIMEHVQGEGIQPIQIFRCIMKQPKDKPCNC